MYQVIYWWVIFACFIYKTDFRLQTKQRVMLEYILRHCTSTLWQIVLWISYTKQTYKESSRVEITVLVSSFGVHTAITCLRLGIGVGHRNMWTQCEHEGSNTLAGVITPQSQKGTIFWESLRGAGEKPQHTEQGQLSTSDL